MKIKRRFEESVERLYKQNYHLATEVCKLGYPSENTSRPTAWLQWDKEKKKIIFFFNPKFAANLSDEEFDFIVGHETRHFINCHIFTLRDKLEHMERMQEPKKDIYRFVDRFGIAADCVVNDTLVNIDALGKIKDFPIEVMGELKRSPLYFGEDTVGMDCEDLTVMEVYYMLPENIEGSSPDEHAAWMSFFNDDGSLNKDFVKAVKDFVENNLENSALTDEALDALDEMKDKMEKSKDPSTRSILAGSGIGGKKRPINITNDNIGWDKLLSSLVETKKTEDRWNRPNRKLSSFYPDVILPREEPQDDQEVIVFIDSSSSMVQADVTRLTNVCRNAPKHIKMKGVHFDTACFEFNLKTEEPVSRGGTSFDIIEKYLQGLKKYPKAIFVLTDGYGTNVNPQHPNRWAWILNGNRPSKSNIGNMKNYLISDLLR